jgi:hypothetical protein
MECVRRAVAVEIENLPSELYAVEEQYRRIVEEVAAYVAERGRLERGRGTKSCTAASESGTSCPSS